MSQTRILLTGATGYIGGSVLTTLTASTAVEVQNAQIDVLIRGPERVSEFQNLRVGVIVFKSLDETEFIRKLASNYDVIINTASAFHTESAIAMITGLHDRETKTGRKTHLIHTSGTSSMADRPVSKVYLESRELHDTDDVYAYQQSREAHEAYQQRTTDLAVFRTGIDLSVKTTIIMAPTIFGIGTGPVNRLSIQIPTLIRRALQYGHAVVIGDGQAEWDHVHIADLVTLFELVLVKVLKGENVPYGAQGLLFAETGRHTWMDVSRGIAAAGSELGLLATDEVRGVSLPEAAAWAANGSEQVRELGFASNARSSATLSRALGWQPQKTETDWHGAFKEDFEAVAKTVV
ncbi:NAD dependent epimerase/dehydratase family protein [Aspergillus bombycis]|uniref:NAD dependent epimerase/dehydratase family protein n=1 Tax=Aspergillus bombycis TaxID=109264 RepID=A0A1F8A4H9_9EURO|nr:NAD dependent epimerase/dehydratase family protein [Aspergillus bombycis]OGM46626.1 NAD dependent epimerase/dehydratase family protein [Aspergillus bombycis]